MNFVARIRQTLGNLATVIADASRHRWIFTRDQNPSMGGLGGMLSRPILPIVLLQGTVRPRNHGTQIRREGITIKQSLGA
jgi:hypothetical protein